MGSPINAMHVHSDVHSDVGSLPGSFKLPAMHDIPGRESPMAVHEEVIAAAHPPVPDVPGVIHGKAASTSAHFSSLIRTQMVSFYQSLLPSLSRSGSASSCATST